MQAEWLKRANATLGAEIKEGPSVTRLEENVLVLETWTLKLPHIAHL